LSPDLEEIGENVIGCAFQLSETSTNNNCVINSYAMLNDRRYPGLDTSSNQLAREITRCFLDLKLPDLITGNPINPITDGMPKIYNINVIFSILPLKDPFLLIGSVTETLRDHYNRYGGSPFAGDCPEPGPFVISIRIPGSMGHSVMCQITEDGYCLETGAARITCYEHLT